MRLAKVIGNVVATIKHADHAGCKLLLVQPVDAAGEPAGDSLIAIDGAQAGVGSRVLLCEEGKGARQVLDNSTVPCEAVIVGIVDHVTMERD